MTVTTINLCMNCVFILSICIILGRNTLWKQIDATLRRIFASMTILLLIILSTDVLAILISGKSFPFCRPLSYTINSIYYLGQTAFSFYFLMLADYWCFRNKRRLEKYFVIRMTPALIEFALIMINPFMNWVFLINEENVYERGEFYFVNMFIFYYYFLYAIVLTIVGCVSSKRDLERKRQNKRLMGYLFLPCCGVLYVTFMSGLSILWPLISISVFLASTDEQEQLLTRRSMHELREQEQTAEFENELTKKSVSMVKEQLHPEFLQDTLTIIRDMYEEKPEDAREALNAFSCYLKGNVACMDVEGMISFEEELLHVTSYLYLEQLRFHGKIRTVIDCNVTGFQVPPLSLMVFAENAVRDGITMKKNGGTITIATSEEEDFFTIMVADDGNGLNPLSLKEEEVPYMSVATTISRIEHKCNGTVKISAMFGEGMQVIIRLPKEAQFETVVARTIASEA